MYILVYSLLAAAVPLTLDVRMWGQFRMILPYNVHQYMHWHC
jgi:hypothetical protein